MFQFHNGSIKRREAHQWAIDENISFNSTMVRLKGVWIFEDALELIIVSIPQWFD